MKFTRIIISILVFFNATLPCYTQNIIKRMNNYVLIDATENNGFEIGKEYFTYRIDPFEGEIKIGKVKIIKFKNGKCAAQIISENMPITINDQVKISNKVENIEDELFDIEDLLPQLEIKKKYEILKVSGDYALIDANRNDGIELYNILEIGSNKYSTKGKLKIVKIDSDKCIGLILSGYSQNDFHKGDFVILQDNNKSFSNYWDPLENEKKASNFLGISSVILGTIGAGIGYYYYNQADKTYKDYQVATTTEDAVMLYDKTIKHQSNAKLSFGIGSIFISLGILDIIFNNNSKSNYSVKPYSNNYHSGLSLKLNLSK